MYKFNSGEFCAGGGGSAEGFKDYFKHIWLNDYDKTCCETLQQNFPETEIILDDINKLNFTEKKYQNLPFVFIGSPCQSFSYAGKKQGIRDPRGAILFKFLDFLEIANPKTFLIENVKGLVTHEDGLTLASIIRDMEELNYEVKYEILDASYYGVPQKRERVFIFGSLLDGEFEFPNPSNQPTILRGVLDNIENNTISCRYPDKKIKLFKKIPAGKCWKSLPLALQKGYLGESFKSGGGKTGILARLSWDKPSLTLLTTPSQKQTERCHPDEIRPLTVKEYARIQTFPDTYRFAGSSNQIYKQIGNAVAVKLANRLAKQIHQYLTERKYMIDDLQNTPLKKAIQKSQPAFTKLAETYKKTIELDDIDIFKKLFDIKYLQITDKQWELAEQARKLDKSVNNQIGYIHQTILGSADGWKNLDDSVHTKLKKKYKVDLCNDDFTIFIELKNKHNTLNSTSKTELVRRMKEIKKIHPNARTIIAAINSNKNATDTNNIEYLDGWSVYKLVFGYPCFSEFINWLNIEF